MRLLWFISLLIFAVGCEDSRTVPRDGDDDSTGDGGSDVDTDADTDADDDDDSHNCGEADFPIEILPIRLMILQDMSGTMTETLGTDTKWNIAKGALTEMLQRLKGQGMLFGFDIFPDGSDSDNFCGVDYPVMKDCALDNEDAIVGLMSGLKPAGNTPLGKAMESFALKQDYAPGFTNAKSNKYLLVVSDGKDSCYYGSVDKLTEVTETLLNEHRVRTFVIGFGTGADPEQLNAIAAAGGTDFKEYFDAQSSADLKAALDEISSSIVSCYYDVQQPDQEYDPEKVNFYFDGKVVGWDPDCEKGQGWTWTTDAENEVMFCEESCSKLADVDKISVEFGCPSVPVG